MSTLNTRHHRAALVLFALIALAHWAEHITQAIQMWALGWPMSQANGVLGLVWPWLIRSEWLHYCYALVMLIGLIMLRPGFTGRARAWWTVAMWIQVWHHFEHLLLVIQANSGHFFFGRTVQTSLGQLLVPRMELHLFYTTIVTVPAFVAMWMHMMSRRRPVLACSCTPISPVSKFLTQG